MLALQNACKHISQLVSILTLKSSQHCLDITPVNYVADAIVSISLSDHTKPHANAKAFNIANPHPPSYADIGAAMKACGCSLHASTYAEWRAKLLDTKLTPLEPLLSFFPEHELALHTPEWDLRHTRGALAGQITCPRVDVALMSVYLQSLAGRGLVHKRTE